MILQETTKPKESVTKMFKKVGIATALSTALLLGGAFTSTADASANQDQSTNPSYKVYYSVNGQTGNVSEGDIQGLINKVLNGELDWKNIDWKSIPAKEQNQKQADAPAKQEASEQAETPAKQEAPAKEKAPAKEQEQEAATPVQQPAQKEEQSNQNQETSQQLSQFEQEVVELTNQERAKQGLSPLEVDTELSKVAREKSRDMATSNYFDHNSPNHGSPFDMMKSYGISYRTAGENIAKGQQTPEEVVNAWMNSEGHRANILNGEYTHIGVGYVEQGNHWTQQFIGK